MKKHRDADLIHFWNSLWKCSKCGRKTDNIWGCLRHGCDNRAALCQSCITEHLATHPSSALKGTTA